MVDIVERLKDMSEFRHMDRSQDEIDEIMREAADEITRLRSERDAAKAMCDEMVKVLEEAKFALFSGDMTIKDRADQSIRLALAAYRKAQGVGK